MVPRSFYVHIPSVLQTLLSSQNRCAKCDNMAKLEMKKKSMILGAILCVSLTVLLVACSKTKNCDCILEDLDTHATVTVSFSDYDKECSSISYSEIMSKVGGDRTDFSGLAKNCYEK